MILPIKKILISREELEQRITGLADEINQAYLGEELVLISVLKGSVMFLTGLMKELDLDVEIGFLYLSSYQGETAPQTEVNHYHLPFPDIKNRNVLLVEDILDSGASLSCAFDICKQQEPASLKTCVLLVKKDCEKTKTPPVDFKGFDIPNEFVVGYGLDHREKYRQLPYIAVPDISD